LCRPGPSFLLQHARNVSGLRVLNHVPSLSTGIDGTLRRYCIGSRGISEGSCPLFALFCEADCLFRRP
jgi:hypothetical protein